MSVKFTEYLHDDWEESPNEIAQLSEEVQDNIGRPFYELVLGCELDESTNRVKIVSINGKALQEAVEL